MSSEFRKKVNYLIHDLNQGVGMIGMSLYRLKKLENAESDDEIYRSIKSIESGLKSIRDIEDYFYKYAQTHPDWDKKEEQVK